MSKYLVSISGEFFYSESAEDMWYQWCSVPGITFIVEEDEEGRYIHRQTGCVFEEEELEILEEIQA